jgi:YVTN family beta-propeller protein
VSRPRLARHALAALVPLGLLWLAGRPLPADDAPKAGGDAEPHRSPVALALSADGARLLTANQTAGTVSLIDAEAGKVLAECPTGEKPAGVAFAPDGRRAVVSHWYGYDLAILDVGPDSLAVSGRVEVGPEPRGVAVAPDGKTAYVAIGVANEVARVDLDAKAVTGRIAVGREPRGLALSPDGGTLVVGNARAGSVSVIDAHAWTLAGTIPTLASNLRQVAVGPQGEWAYVAGMENRKFATNQPNIDKGWVLGQRLLRVPLDGAESFETLSLDPQGQAAADAHGVAVGADGAFLAVGLGGTHEVMIFRTDGKRLPWRRDSARDLIAPELLRGDGRFRRVPLGGRPTELAFAPDGSTLYVANYLADAVQVVDARDAKLVRTIELGGPEEVSLARRGEALFHDATRSFNQWYSCNTCHPDGHTGGLDFDTLNDGWQDLSTAHARSRKKVPTLRRVAETGPWTWHGWQDSLDDAMVESFTKSMQGKKPSAEDVEAIVAFLGTLDFPRNPNLPPDGTLSESARRGEEVFRSSKAACVSCHGGPEFTDGEVHVVGLEERGDVYKGYNPPSLRGLYDKDPYLHDGRAADLREALTKWHNPEDVTGLGELSPGELDDLIAYLKTL